MSARSLWSILLLLGVVGVVLHGTEAGTVEKCSNGTARFLYTPKSVLELHNMNFKVFPLYPDGSVYYDAHGTVTFVGFQEFYRPPSPSPCYEPATGFPVSGNSYLSTYRNISVDELNCEYSNEISVVQGVTLNATVVKMTHPDLPNFEAFINLTIADGSLVVPLVFSPTQDDWFVANHRPNNFKYSIGINNWPWGAPVNDSYIDLFWRISDLTMPSSAKFGSYRAGNISYVYAQTEDGTVRFEQTMDWRFVLDDVIFVRNISDIAYDNLPLPVPWPGTIFQPTFALCHFQPPGVHWSRYMQDPTLSILFSPPPTDTPQPVDKHKKGIVVAAIVVPVVIVLLFLGLLAAFAIKPELKNYFRPYRKRNEQDSKAALWHAGKAPAPQ